MAAFIVTDMRPISIVEGTGFKNLLTDLDPRYECPSRNTIMERYIVPMYNITKDEVKSYLQCAPSHSITTDAWTSKNMDSFITTTAHFITEEFSLESVVLDTQRVTGSHTADRLAQQIQETCNNWELREVKAVTDNAANIQLALSLLDMPHFGCFAHTINLAVSKGLNDTSVKKVIGKVRTLVSKFKTSYLRKEELQNNEKLLELAELQLIQDVSTRWNSIYYMISRLLDVYPAVYAVLYASPHKHLLLTDTERTSVENLRQILLPFEKATRKVSAEKIPTGGLILPYMYQFSTESTQVLETDTQIGKTVKALIKADLSSRYVDDDQRDLLLLLSVLDPRVRSMDWMAEEDRDRAYFLLKKECERISQASPVTSVPMPATSVDQNDEFSFLSLGQTEETHLTQMTDELNRYKQKERSLGLSVVKTPLQWWKENQGQYPILAKVARIYLGVPATSVPSERVFSSAGSLMNKREHLLPENTDLLIFLYHNFPARRARVLSVMDQL